MIALGRLLDIERRFRGRGGIDDAFGDGFLLAHNPIFRNVRFLARTREFEFVSDGEIRDLYAAAPLLALPGILCGRKIPFVPNGRALDRLGVGIDWSVVAAAKIEPFLGKNALLHESAHAIAETILPAEGADLVVLKTLVAEAFACAVESVTVLSASSELEAWFLRFHTPFTADAGTKAAFRRIAQAAGRGRALGVLVEGFLRMNFLRESERDFALWTARAMSTQALPGDLAEDVGLLFRFAESLSGSFRRSTAEMYFSLFHRIDDITSSLPTMDIEDQMARAGDRWVSALSLALETEVSVAGSPQTECQGAGLGGGTRNESTYQASRGVSVAPSSART